MTSDEAIRFGENILTPVWKYEVHNARRYRVCPFCMTEYEDDKRDWHFCPECGNKLDRDDKYDRMAMQALTALSDIEKMWHKIHDYIRKQFADGEYTEDTDILDIVKDCLIDYDPETSHELKTYRKYLRGLK